MTERTLIFNGKDVQIGYIEGNEVFDLAGRKRCNYIVATGNLYDSNNKVIGHVSLDGTFVGASWRCDELFGKPSGEAHAGRSRARMRRARDRPKQSSAARPKKLLLETAAPNAPEQRLAHSQPSRGDPEAGSNTFETIAEQMQELPPVSDGGSTVEALKPITSSASESELLGRAIGMIRSGLRHNNPPEITNRRRCNSCRRRSRTGKPICRNSDNQPTSRHPNRQPQGLREPTPLDPSPGSTVAEAGANIRGYAPRSRRCSWSRCKGVWQQQGRECFFAFGLFFFDSRAVASAAHIKP